MEEIVVACLLCDKPVTVPAEAWTSIEAPFACCDGCTGLVDRGAIAWPMVKMIFVMRHQIGNLMARLTATERNVGLLFGAQRDIERDYLQRKAG